MCLILLGRDELAAPFQNLNQEDYQQVLSWNLSPMNSLIPSSFVKGNIERFLSSFVVYLLYCFESSHSYSNSSSLESQKRHLSYSSAQVIILFFKA